MVPEYSTMSSSGQDISFEEIDMDFEFDAPRFYDFSRPELYSETKEIEMWFQSSGNYPPSPYSPKFKFEPFKEMTSTSFESKPIEVSKPVVGLLDTGLNLKDKYHGFIYYKQTVKKDVSKTKPKSKNKSSCFSTLTKPTASLLARQNKPLKDNYSVQLLTRCQRSLGKLRDNLSPILVSKLQSKENKIQKLEAKVAEVRRSKLTVPKEPNLRTAERSLRHRSTVNLETEQNAKSKITSSKRDTTNKNISPKLSSKSLPKSNTPRSKVLQAFGLRTSSRAKERSSNAKIDAIHANEATHSKTIHSIVSSKSRTVKEKRINSQMLESKIGLLDSQRSSKEELSEAISNKLGNQSLRRILDINRSLDLCRNFDTQEVTGNLIIA